MSDPRPYIDKLERALEQAIRNLNEAHNELMRQQDVENPEEHDWPEWTSQANTIRWAERLLGKRLAKTQNWTEHPADAPEQDSLVSQGGEGDCLRTALGATLCIPKRYVPPFHRDEYFAKEPEDAHVRKPYWHRAMRLWLQWLGYDVEYVSKPLEKNFNWDELPRRVMASGQSPRGDFGHAVVWGRNGLVHDPHPSGDGLAGDPREFWIIRER